MSDDGRDVQWNTTWLDGKTITWIEADGEVARIVSVRDPGSAEQARRVHRGEVSRLDGGQPGLTVYGTDADDRPTFEEFSGDERYGYLVQGIREGRGITRIDRPATRVKEGS